MGSPPFALPPWGSSPPGPWGAERTGSMLLSLNFGQRRSQLWPLTFHAQSLPFSPPSPSSARGGLVPGHPLPQIWGSLVSAGCREIA